MADCIFCKIIDGSIPSNKAYEDDKIIVLVVPKQHICCADELDESNADVIAYIFTKIPQIAKSLGLENGYRIVNNCGDDGCQSIKHIHFHILGGKKLSGQMC